MGVEIITSILTTDAKKINLTCDNQQIKENIERHIILYKQHSKDSEDTQKGIFPKVDSNQY
jgi:hypothetical protein